METFSLDDAVERDARAAREQFINRGKQIGQELRTSVAIGVLRTFLSERAKVAKDRLAEVSADDPKEIRFLQYEAWRAKAFDEFLSTIVEAADRFAETDDAGRPEEPTE